MYRRPTPASSSSMFPSLADLLELHPRGTFSSPPEPAAPPPRSDSPAATVTLVALGSVATLGAIAHGLSEAPQCAPDRLGELQHHSATVSSLATAGSPREALRELSIALGFRAHPTEVRAQERTMLPPGAMPITQVAPIPIAQTPVPQTPVTQTPLPLDRPHLRGSVRRIQPSLDQPVTSRLPRNR